VTVRAVVAVALAAALLGASLPAVERARVQHADARVAGEVERLETVARSLTTSNDVVRGDGPPARARMTLHLPRRSWGSRTLSAFRVPPPASNSDVTWQVRGSDRIDRDLPDVDLAAPPDGITLREGGRHDLVLELRRHDGDRIVAIRRPATGGSGEA